ncbi:thioesterase family protein [Lutimaribacter sp. EGI FJ00015]|uniref:Thioesterase family protein n=1 Tax=Lutimaribacter degradans TaxID=2945989 RepID=A0ACC5ZQZ8_9RHOB|nr:thioesterase family protein [Lutimaribacter sp. EGI FJ00013]MCM2560726.1 thioesterase family protein [Lutimaribacter sp. EGI FJ00013]MCO0612328.1 thioesterase family protein [Lutimaribacter sp. EGI FJ00015]MCO0634551.1 thioesterase family protein [Lutimaribacter sp. EGI FJ00014]
MLLKSSLMTVVPEWIDYNGHLNMAYYNVLFDRCADEVYPMMGFGPDYAETRKLTTYTAEFHVCYVQELHEGHRVYSTFQMIDYDEKRFHSYQELYHEDGWLAATAEALTLHVDMTGPRVAAMPPDVMEKVKALYDQHSTLPRPDRVGRSIGIRRKAG